MHGTMGPIFSEATFEFLYPGPKIIWSVPNNLNKYFLFTTEVCLLINEQSFYGLFQNILDWFKIVLDMQKDKALNLKGYNQIKKKLRWCTNLNATSSWF